MLPHMSQSELILFRSFLATTGGYVEFGSGGSTFLAAQLASRFVISTDSAQEWTETVSRHCAEAATRITPDMIHADIGSTKEWGYPRDEARRADWPRYYSLCWHKPEARTADLYMVDGRFRVACAMQILLHAQAGALVMVHDFASRAHYHVVRRFAREIAIAEELSVFQTPVERDYASIALTCVEYAHDAR
jgi:hypothetical protein